MPSQMNTYKQAVSNKQPANGSSIDKNGKNLTKIDALPFASTSARPVSFPSPLQTSANLT